MCKSRIVAVVKSSVRNVSQSWFSVETGMVTVDKIRDKKE